METGVLPVFLFMTKGKYLKFKYNRNKLSGLQKQNQKMYPADKVVRGVELIAVSMIETEGLELIHVEFTREPVGWVLRLYIDRPGGVTVQDCADISRIAGDLFDVALEPWLENNIKEDGNTKTEYKHRQMYLPSYTLEVSSPGERRPLKKLKDFIRFQGKKILIKVHSPINGQKRFKGILSEATDTHVTIETSTLTAAINHENIRVARLDA